MKFEELKVNQNIVCTTISTQSVFKVRVLDGDTVILKNSLGAYMVYTRNGTNWDRFKVGLPTVTLYCFTDQSGTDYHDKPVYLSWSFKDKGHAERIRDTRAKFSPSVSLVKEVEFELKEVSHGSI